MGSGEQGSVLSCEGPGQHPVCLGQAMAHAGARIWHTSHRKLCFGLNAGLTHTCAARRVLVQPMLINKLGSTAARAAHNRCMPHMCRQKPVIRRSCAQWRHWCHVCQHRAGAERLRMSMDNCRESSWHSRWAAAALVGGWQGRLLVVEAALEACCCI